MITWENIIKIYYNPSSKITYNSTVKYFEKNNIKYEMIKFSKLTNYDIKNFLMISSKLEDILNRNIIKNLNWDMKLSELIKLIKEKPTLLKTPIIIDYQKKIMITGYDENKLDVWIRKISDYD